MYPNDETNESAVMIRRHLIADVVSARSAHRTGLQLRKKYGKDWAAQAFALREAAMRSARRHRTRLLEAQRTAGDMKQ